MTLRADILAVLESSKLPLTIGDIIQDASVMPVARGEPMRKGIEREVREEVNRLVRTGQVVSSARRNVYGSELVYQLKVEKKATQRSLLS